MDDILDALSPEELGDLPKPIWRLLDWIAGPEADEAEAVGPPEAESQVTRA